jgi:uncharacterized protein (DUF1810 family)
MSEPFHDVPPIDAQGPTEQCNGKKTCHSSLAEAQAYLKHPILGPTLRHCTELVARKQKKKPFAYKELEAAGMARV